MFLNTDIRKYVQEIRRAAAGVSWTAKPELPTANEILGIDENNGCADGSVSLLANKVQGSWPSTEIYLRTHYGLLREDAVAPLRDAVAYVKEDPRMKDSTDVCIYEKVYIVGLTCADAGVAVKLQFSTARAGKNIVWEYSPRLTTGNIVALTPANDMFKSKCIVAVVAARPLEELKKNPSEIDIFYAQADEAEFDPQKEFVMVEARSGYYEAARHTLAALQKMARDGSFPFSEYLCGLQPTIDPPEYIKLNPFVDVSSAMTEGDCAKIDVLSSWPPPPKSLDSSQWAALRQILTKELAIIQGPPGTGKTHVSTIALKSLLSTLPCTDPPIIIAAQTNHALDQLLRHVSQFEDNYVRIGGRSTDVDIKKRTIFELRKTISLPVIPGGLSGPSRKHIRRLSEDILELLAPFSPENSWSPLPASVFLKLNLINQSQYDSLVSGAEGWVHAGDQLEPLAAWLGDSKVKFEVVYKENNFGFIEDEIDLEYEQLKELELEQGLNEEDSESLRGPYMSLGERFKGRGHLPTHALSCGRQVLEHEDLWKIPPTARGGIYSALQAMAKKAILDSLRSLVKRYNHTARNLQTGRWEQNCSILQSARVIGMTTTGLSKYRALISSIKPKIILVEEAAEVIEAPIAAACIKSLEHLILVGDHKQLQGSCAVKELEDEPFFLKISLFERLVHNGVEFKSLTKQRRMPAEIRRVLAPIYDNLDDHPSVNDKPEVPGMGGINSFFYCHGWPESSDSLLSKYNYNEAQMIVGFFLYLHLNKVPVEDITILTFYNGQRKKILKGLRDNPLLQGQYLKVSTVDSYQGEENEIVILSLVRSNENTGNVGFLSIENRVCVALSRAKRGFYIFGNAEFLALASPLWWEVVQIVSCGPKRIGYHVPLTCDNHQTRTYLKEPGEWSSTDGAYRIRKLNVYNHAFSIFHAGIHVSEFVNFLVNATGGRTRSRIRTQSPREQANVLQDYNEHVNGGAEKDDTQLASETELLEIREHVNERARPDLLLDGVDDNNYRISLGDPFGSPSAVEPRLRTHNHHNLSEKN
ncbi:helicase required for RNAi-mediated heterochromatin assembly 1 [Paracoccidioides lutzii Pb01]|uniref:Helicase required for RNAi-mediated heterochromatin assembly 1 n=1 Tax=Paracoccidioides lutzii (strain ATCC MYA-826 / Pb01) TaxID=502779 RepID=C1H039_PARBA|nr:helicase required for RNAi-mediated heterochromatin assembly 1 [Paracoccidioides lutzii Pb01]EEH33080.2 helicase required for RNAi-mediated heterochromatin assembly 1 [Paracoccidioides lutzii Pb01]